MKKASYTTLIAGVSLLATVSHLVAMPFAGSNEDLAYAAKAQSLDWLSAGIWGGSVKRSIKWDNGVTDVFDSTPIDLYVGVRVLSWLDVIGVAGTRGTDSDWKGSGDTKGEWGAGLQARLFTHEIAEPALMVDTLRLTANASWLSSGTTFGGASEDWSETSASLLLGLYNQTVANKLYGPETLGLYAGPIYSALTGDNFSEDESIGFAVGLQVFLVDSVGLEVQGQFFKESSVIAGLSYQF